MSTPFMSNGRAKKNKSIKKLRWIELAMISKGCR